MQNILSNETHHPTVEDPKTQPRHELKKMLGVAFGIAVLVGGTIGSGILRNPGTIAQLINNKWLILGCWLFGGLYALMGVGSFSELATMFPKAGGAYVYVKEAFGNYAGFLTGWFDYITNGITPAYFCILIGEYLVLLFPSLRGQEKLLAIAFLLAFTLLHLTGVKTGSIIVQVTSTIKVLFFAALIVACFSSNHLRTNSQQEPSLTTLFTGTALLAVLRSLQLITGMYSGWNVPCFFAEEDKNPNKNLPKALYTGVVILVMIYVLVNAAFLHVLPVSSLANSSLAASDVAKVIFGPSGAVLITVIAVFSLISILNAYMMIPARILFSMSRDGFFVPWGSYVNEKGTPTFSLIFAAIMNLILINIGSFTTLFALGAFMAVTVFMFAYIALVKLRIKRPEAARPYRAWGYPYTTILLILFSIGLFIGFAFSDPRNFLVIIVVTLLSYPAYILMVKRKIIAS